MQIVYMRMYICMFMWVHVCVCAGVYACMHKPVLTSGTNHPIFQNKKLNEEARLPPQPWFDKHAPSFFILILRIKLKSPHL